MRAKGLAAAGAVFGALAAAGCGGHSAIAGNQHRHAPTSAGAATTDTTTAAPATPSPVATVATLQGNCQMGFEWPTVNPDGTLSVSQYSGFRPGTPRPLTVPTGDYQGTYDPAMAYQLTLVNDSQTTAAVDSFAVVFYDSAGTEAGSDQQSAGNPASYIVPGQSLTWTELADQTVSGYGDGGNDANIPAHAATCSLVQWYRPAP